MSEVGTKTAKAHMSKKRYEDFKHRLEGIYESDEVKNILGMLNEVLNYDPEKSTYTERHYNNVKAYRNRQRESKMKTT